MKAYVGTKVLPHSFWTSPLDWSVLLAQRPGCFTPDLKACSTHCRPSRFRRWSGRLKKKKSVAPARNRTVPWTSSRLSSYCTHYVTSDITVWHVCGILQQFMGPNLISGQRSTDKELRVNDYHKNYCATDVRSDTYDTHSYIGMRSRSNDREFTSSLRSDWHTACCVSTSMQPFAYHYFSLGGRGETDPKTLHNLCLSFKYHGKHVKWHFRTAFIDTEI